MTTNSTANIGRHAIRLVAERRPDIKVKSVTGRKMGPVRVARITLETGEFLQVMMPPLGTHSWSAANEIADAICGMVKAEPND
jgi:hypothetical protein